jgi:hypothetical protein
MGSITINLSLKLVVSYQSSTFIISMIVSTTHAKWNNQHQVYFVGLTVPTVSTSLQYCVRKQTHARRRVWLQRNFWAAQNMVVRQNLPENLQHSAVADAVIMCSTAEALEDKDAQTSSIFYVDGGVFTSIDAIYLQTRSDHLLSSFRRVILEADIKKFKSMICLPGKVQCHISSSVYDRRMIGEGKSYKDRKHRNVQCDK